MRASLPMVPNRVCLRSRGPNLAKQFISYNHSTISIGEVTSHLDSIYQQGFIPDRINHKITGYSTGTKICNNLLCYLSSSQLNANPEYVFENLHTQMMISKQSNKNTLPTNYAIF